MIDFLGVGSCLPEYEEADTASILINRHILVDTGWHTVRNLLRAGVDPGDITHVFFTHVHQDHYLGLVQLLFYRVNRYGHVEDLTICGPEGVEEIVNNAMQYAGFDCIYAGKERNAAVIAAPRTYELPSEGEIDIDQLKVRYTFYSKQACSGWALLPFDGSGRKINHLYRGYGRDRSAPRFCLRKRCSGS